MISGKEETIIEGDTKEIMIVGVAMIEEVAEEVATIGVAVEVAMIATNKTMGAFLKEVKDQGNFMKIIGITESLMVSAF